MNLTEVLWHQVWVFLPKKQKNAAEPGKLLMRRELELRTQHTYESLLEYVRAMQELYLLADPLASDAEKVERVIRPLHLNAAILP